MTERSCGTCLHAEAAEGTWPCRVCGWGAVAFDRWQPKDDTYTHPVVGKVHVRPTPGVTTHAVQAAAAELVREIKAACQGGPSAEIEAKLVAPLRELTLDEHDVMRRALMKSVKIVAPAARPKPGAPITKADPVPLTEEAIWNSDEIMACNTGLMMLDLVHLVRAVERAHGITGEAAPVAPGAASDFETHPPGTAKRLAELEANWAGSSDTCSRLHKRIAQLEQEVAACERRLADMAREMQKFMDEAQQRR